MNWTRPLLAITLAGTTATAVSVSPTAAAQPEFIPGTGPCTAVPEGLNLIIPHSGGVAMTNSDGYEMLDVAIAGGPSMAVRGPDGTVWAVATHEGNRAVHRVSPGGEATPIADGEVDLSSVGWLDGRSAAVVVDHTSDHVRPDEPDFYGAILADFSDGQQVDVGAAGGPEYGASSVTIGAGRLAQGSVVDLAESFDYYDTTGAEITDWFSPTATAEYNAPPFYQWPIAADAADAGDVILSWVEGPDWDGATGKIVGGWSLVVADAVTGSESLRLDLGAPGENLVHADFDGRFWVGTFSDTTDPEAVPEPARVIVVDTQATTPAAVDAACPPGVTATIDRLGTAEPPVPASPVCPSYEPNDRYPIRLCDEGPAVSAVQAALAAAGHDLDIDGYFGPGTESEVRRFQDAHELEVDGLVGEATWAALIQFAPPTGSDGDGNGVIDPWEIDDE